MTDWKVVILHVINSAHTVFQTLALLDGLPSEDGWECALVYLGLVQEHRQKLFVKF